MKVAIVVPAYNEEKTVGDIVHRAKKFGTVIVVDDASQDATAKTARREGATVVRHAANKGLGASLRDGFAKAFSLKADVIVTMDADGQHVPEEIPHLLNPIKEGCDFVIGARNLEKYPFAKRFGNFFLNCATNFISGTSLRDTESGFRAIRSEALKKFHLGAERYEIAVEIIFEVGRNGLRMASVPVSSPLYVKGVSVRDGVKNFLYLLHRRKSVRKDYARDTHYVMKKNLRM